MALRTRIQKNARVDAFLSKATTWQKEFAKLRMILLTSGLTEEFKWGKPCYAFQETNLIVLCGLKDSCALGFLKGALLKDAHGVLTAPGPSSQSMRWFKFTSVQAIAERQAILKAYIAEAIAAEKAGLKVSFKKQPEPVPAELQRKLEEIPALKSAFAALTPGRQRGYILYFSAAKQARTREARIANYMPKILKGRGFNDR